MNVQSHHHKFHRSSLGENTNSYLLWLGILFGVGGLHRFYNGRIWTGLLWLMTGGLFGIGQFIDLFLIPQMVDERLTRLRARYGLSPAGAPLGYPVVQKVVPAETLALTREQLMVELARIAQARGGQLSVTQGVLETGVGFAQVEGALKAMVKTGYVSVDNDPETGVVVYRLDEYTTNEQRAI